MPGTGKRKGLIEIQYEIVVKIGKGPPAVAGGKADDLIFSRDDPDVGAFVKCIYHQKGTIRCGKCEPELRCSLSRGQFCCYICIRKIYTVIIGPHSLRFMREPAGPVILPEFQ